MKADDKEDDVFDEVNLDDDREIFLGEKSSAFAARRSSGITSESGSTSDDSKKEKESAASGTFHRRVCRICQRICNHISHEFSHSCLISIKLRKSLALPIHEKSACSLQAPV